MIEKDISEYCYLQGQSWIYRWAGRIVVGNSPATIKRFTVQVEIRRNAHNHQSWLHGNVLDGLKWSLLVWRPMTEKTATCFAVNPHVELGVFPSTFHEDKVSIVEELEQLVGKYEE